MFFENILSVDHSFYTKVKEDGSVTRKINGIKTKLQVKKVWVDLMLHSQFIFRRKRFVNKYETKALFVCKSCEELKRHVDCYANIIIHNPDDREEDEYRLILNTVPDPSSHFCSPSGKKIDSISCPTISVSKLFNLNHIGIASLVILAGGRHFFYGCIKIVLIQVLNVLSTDLNEKLFTH